REAVLGKTYPILELDRARSAMEPAARWRPFAVDLAPAQWLWLPSQRTLPNTFVLFRKEIELAAAPARATAWLTADSRYRLTVNGQRVQWGPAPCDPRQYDVDPAELTALLKPGKNVIGVEVLHYGIGDGTWPAGKPGMIFLARVEMPGDRVQQVASDASWRCAVDRAHRPGAPKRWYLRALQEEFDARLHPAGWDTPQFVPDAQWIVPWAFPCRSDKPAASGGQPGGDSMDGVPAERSALRIRQIPLLKESIVPAMRLTDARRVVWTRDPADWFDFRLPGCFEIDPKPLPSPELEGGWELPAAPGPRDGVLATFEFKEQIVGWPKLTIDAAEGTIVELVTQESHDPGKTAWLDSHFFSWSRHVCREGKNEIEPFEFESLRWMQIHVRNARRPVRISAVGVRRRVFPWPNPPQIRCSEPALQRLFDAAVNTLYNSAQETCVDGMGRERQQYSGDGGHQLLAVRCLGEDRLSARFLRTFSEGITPEGYFLDCWPAYDRLARVMQKQVDGAYWGPLLDHGVGFNFDCAAHYEDTGDLAAVAEPYPRLVRFADYLESLRGKDGLLPVENLGIPTVWIDHTAYKQQRHKQCAFNLYAAAMFKTALAPLAAAMGDRPRAERCRRLGDELLRATVRKYWDRSRGLFVANLPWAAEEKETRLCDRSLATSILFDQCPGGQTAAAVKALAQCPAEMGLSYPCNANWRYWALCKAGRAEVVIADFRKRWATMRSVVENNTIQEDWTAAPDSTAQWSHCAVAPIYVLFRDIAGIRPTAPGFGRFQVRPQLGDLPDLELTYETVRGPIHFSAKRTPGGHRVRVSVPRGCAAELVTPLARTPLKPGEVNEHFVAAEGK
ncbi:MAG: alpha-L-rhamnosidase-related protein, partial [Pirellulales bacterium]